VDRANAARRCMQGAGVGQHQVAQVPRLRDRHLLAPERPLQRPQPAGFDGVAQGTRRAQPRIGFPHGAQTAQLNEELRTGLVVAGRVFVLRAEPRPPRCAEKLIASQGHPARDRRAAGKPAVPWRGDPQTDGRARDARLAGAEFELLGEFRPPALFVVGPFYS